MAINIPNPHSIRISPDPVNAATRRDRMKRPAVKFRLTTDAERTEIFDRARSDLIGLGREIAEDPTLRDWCRGDPPRLTIPMEWYAERRWRRHVANAKRERDGCCGEWREAARNNGRCFACGAHYCWVALAAAALERFTEGLGKYLEGCDVAAGND